MAHDNDAPTAGPWPDASLLPDQKAPPAEWARFYRDRCGWIVLPTPSPGDLDKIAARDYDDAILSWREDHGGQDPDEETKAALWQFARNDPAVMRRGKGVCGFVKQAEFRTPEAVTDDRIRYWWGNKDGQHRGIAVVLGEGPHPVVLVEVDLHGHDPRRWGDLDGPWGRGADPHTGEALAGPRHPSPSGGLHTLVAWTGEEVSSGGRTALAVGIEVKARGAAPARVPSGSSSPGLAWERWEAPMPGPDALRQRRRPAPKVATEDDDGHDAGSDDDDGEGGAALAAGHVARILSSDTGVADGERNDGAGDIVGMLARPRACPSDVVAACLALVAEESACRDDRAASADAAAKQAEWRRLLTRGPRDADFAADVVATWIRVRDVHAPPWTEAKARKTALSMWKTAAWRVSRQGEDPGAEDFGVGPALAHRPAHWPALPAPPEPSPSATTADPSSATPHDAAGAVVEAAPPYPAPPPGTDPPAARWRGGVDPRTYIRSLSDEYTDEDLAADLTREPISIAEVMPTVDFATGRYRVRDPGTSLATPLAHGWGEHLSRALGGMRPGDFRVIGASGAGAGKTWFACWLANGLAMQTAMRLLGAPGYEKRPIVLPIYVSEMPKKGEMYHRLAGAHLGFDVAALADGTQAHDAPGIVAMAQRHQMTPHEVVARARELERLHGATDKWPMGFARQHVIKRLRLSALPRRTRQAGIVIDHRSGPMLIDHLADAVDCYREDFAKLAAVPTSEVMVAILLDPSQRFTTDAESEKRAIDALLGATAQVLCGELGAAVIATSDTTKDAAKNIPIDLFLGEDANALGARVLAGSYAIVHNADCLLLQAEPLQLPDGGGVDPRRARQWARIIKSRSGGASSLAFPFLWDKHLGQFIPQDPEPLRQVEREHGHGHDQRGRGEYGRGGGRHRDRDRPPGPMVVTPLGSGYARPRHDRADALPD